MASVPEHPLDRHEEDDGDVGHHQPSEAPVEQHPEQENQIQIQDDKERDTGHCKFPPCSKDASIFKRLVYNTVPKEGAQASGCHARLCRCVVLSANA